MANFEVTIDQRWLGQNCLNITKWQFPTNTLQYLQDFTDALRASYSTNVGIDMTDDWAFEACTFRQMDGGGPFTITLQPTAGELVGSNAVGSLPTTVALLVATIFQGPKPNRGKIYFPGLAENNQENSNWGAGTAGRFSTMVQEWADGLVVAGGNAFLRIARPDYVANTWVLDNPVESALTRLVPATIRNRRLST